MFTFRARAGAAPLKHLDADSETTKIANIPRPRGRGPVEAYSQVETYFTAFAFRARAGAAPLKP